MRKRSYTCMLFAVMGLSSLSQAKESEIHTLHCYGGCPLGAPATNDIIVREIYTLSANDLTKMADWVAYRLTPETIGPSVNRNWSQDWDLATDETLTEDNYRDAPATLHIDRGHQAPLAAFSGTKDVQQTNILSNITPQAAALNQGPWQRLEGKERELSKRLRMPVYVYTGPLFERFMRPLPNGPQFHRVPSGYWKVIVTADQRLSAFLMDQNTARGSNYCDSRLPLHEVELRSRLYLFPQYDMSGFGSLDGELGCEGPAPIKPAPDEISTR